MNFTHRFNPAQESPPRRVFLLLHGTGGDENDLLPLGRELDPGAALLSPRGNVLENGMPRFFRRLAEGVFDEADIVRRANELADFVGVAATRYEFDPRRVTAVGYSNGANIAAAVLLLRPEVLASAILFRAMVPLVPPQPPDLAQARVLISSGAHDPIVPVENAERLAAMLRETGANVTLRFEAAGHPLVPGDIAAAKEWLHNGGQSGIGKATA
ncbi:MAG TPA: alpha/beta hydrolase [Chthoniobacterales bacterium]|nr:alpha/beta hydrolase [Chthoniobacterales bacterium]